VTPLVPAPAPPPWLPHPPGWRDAGAEPPIAHPPRAGQCVGQRRSKRVRGGLAHMFSLVCITMRPFLSFQSTYARTHSTMAYIARRASSSRTVDGRTVDGMILATADAGASCDGAAAAAAKLWQRWPHIRRRLRRFVQRSIQAD
jgi:hypothetical protein